MELFSSGFRFRLHKIEFEETMDQKIQEAAEAEAGSDSDSSSSSSGSDADSSDHGLKSAPSKKAKGKAKARPKKAAKEGKDEVKHEKEDASSMAGHSGTNSRTPVQTQSEAEGGGPGNSLLEKCKALIQSLKNVTPWSIWCRNVKEKDIERGVSKGLDLAGKAESSDDKATQDIAAELTEEVNRLTRDEALMNALSKADPATLVNEKKDILDMCKTLDAEKLTALLSEVGRQLCGALLNSDGKDVLFWSFLPAGEAGENVASEIFNLSYVKENANSGFQVSDQLVLQALLQVQQNAVNHFIDRLRTACSESILKSIPACWYMPALCRTDRAQIYPTLSNLSESQAHALPSSFVHCRTPIASSSPLTWVPLDSSVDNKLGVATRSLVDMQRFIVCGRVSGCADHVDNDTKKGFQQVIATSNISARVSLVFKANSQLKRLGLRLQS